MSESNGLRESGEQRNEKPVLGRSKSFGDLNSGSSSIPLELVKQLRDQFDVIDETKSGKINNLQFGSIFPFESEELRDQAFNALQPDNNGLITFDQFLNMMVQFINAQQDEQRVSASPSTLSPRSPLAINLPPRQSESPIYSLISPRMLNNNNNINTPMKEYLGMPPLTSPDQDSYKPDFSSLKQQRESIYSSSPEGGSNRARNRLSLDGALKSKLNIDVIQKMDLSVLENSPLTARLITSRDRSDSLGNRPSSPSAQRIDEISSLIKMFDSDEDGLITYDDMKATLREQGMSIDDDDLEALLLEYEKTRDDKLDYGEFTPILLRFASLSKKSEFETQAVQNTELNSERIQELEHQVRALSTSKTILESQLDGAKHSFQQQKAEIEALQEKLKGFESDSRRETDEFRFREEQTGKELLMLRKDKEDLHEKYKSIESTLKSLEGEHNYLQDQYEKLLKQKEDAILDRDSLESRMSQKFLTEMERMKEEKTDLLTKTKSLQTIVDNQTQAKMQLERERAKWAQIEQDNEDLKAKYVELENEFLSLKQKYSHLEDSMRSQGVTSKKTQEDLEIALKEKADLETSLQTTKQEVETLTTHVNTLSSTSSDTQKSSIEKDQTISNLNAELTDLKSQLATMKNEKELSEKQSQQVASERQQKIEALEKENKQLHQFNESEQKVKKDMTNLWKTAEENYTSVQRLLVTERDKLQRAEALYNSTITSTKAELAEKNSAIEQLQSELTATKNTVTELETKVQLVTKESDEKIRALTESQSGESDRAKALTDELEQVRKNNTELNDKVTALEADLTSKAADYAKLAEETKSTSDGLASAKEAFSRLENDYESTKSQLEAKAAELSKFESESKLQTEEKLKLENELTKTTTQLHVMETEGQELKYNIGELKAQVESEKKDKATLSEELSRKNELLQTYQDTQDKASVVYQEKEVVERQLESTRVKLDSVEGELKQALQTNSSLSAQVSSLNDKLEDLTKQSQATNKLIAEKDQELDKKNKAIEELTSSVNELEGVKSQVAQLTESRDQEQQKAQHLAQEVEEKDKFVSSLQEKLQELKGSLQQASEAGTTVEKLVAEKSQLESELNLSRSQVETLTAEINSTKEALQSTKDQLASEVASLQQQVTDATTEKSSIVEKLTSEKSRVEEDMKSQVEILTQELETSRLTLEQLQSETTVRIETLVKQRDETAQAKEVEQLSTEKARIEEELTSAKSQASELTKEIEQMKQSQEQLQQDLRVQIDNLEQQRSAALADVNSLQNQVSTLSKDVEKVKQLEDELVQAAENNERLSSELSQSKSEVENLMVLTQATSSEKDTHIEKLSKELEEIKTELSSTKKEADTVATKLSEQLANSAQELSSRQARIESLEQDVATAQTDLHNANEGHDKRIAEITATHQQDLSTQVSQEVKLRQDKLDELEKELESVRSELAQTKDSQTSLDKAREHRANEIAEFQKKQESFVLQEVQALSKQLEAKHNQVTELTRELETARGEIKVANEQLSMSTETTADEIKQLKAELESASDALKLAQSNDQKVAEQRELSKRELEELKATNENLTTKLESVEIEVQRLTEECAKLKSGAESSQSEKERSMAEEISKLAAVEKSQREELADRDDTIRQQTVQLSRLAELEDQLKSNDQSTTDLSEALHQQLSVLKEEISAKNAELKANENDKTSLQNTIESLSDEIRSLKSGTNDEVQSTLQATVGKLTNELNSVKDQLTEKEAYAAELKREVEEVQLKLDQATKSEQQPKEQVATHDVDKSNDATNEPQELTVNANSETRSEELARVIKEKDSQIFALTERIERQIQVTEAHMNDVADLTDEVEHLKKTVRSLTEQLETQQQSSTPREVPTESHSSVPKSAQEIESLRQELNAVNSQNEQLERQLSSQKTSLTQVHQEPLVHPDQPREGEAETQKTSPSPTANHSPELLKELALLKEKNKELAERVQSTSSPAPSTSAKQHVEQSSTHSDEIQALTKNNEELRQQLSQTTETGQPKANDTRTNDNTDSTESTRPSPSTVRMKSNTGTNTESTESIPAATLVNDTRTSDNVGSTEELAALRRQVEELKAKVPVDQLLKEQISLVTQLKTELTELSNKSKLTDGTSPRQFETKIIQNLPQSELTIALQREISEIKNIFRRKEKSLQEDKKNNRESLTVSQPVDAKHQMDVYDELDLITRAIESGTSVEPQIIGDSTAQVEDDPKSEDESVEQKSDDDKDIEMYLHAELNRCRQDLDEVRKQLEEEQSERNKEARSSQKLVESLKHRIEHLEGEGAGESPPGKEKKLRNSTDALEKSEIVIKQLTNELAASKNEMTTKSKEHEDKVNAYKRDYSDHIKLLEERLAQIDKDRKLIDESRQLLKLENSRLQREMHENDRAMKVAKELVDEKDKIITDLEQVIAKDKQAANLRHEQDLKKIKSRDQQIESLERTIANLKDTLATHELAANATDVYNNTNAAPPTVSRASKSNRVATRITIGLSALVALVLALKLIAMMVEEEIILRPT